MVTRKDLIKAKNEWLNMTKLWEQDPEFKKISLEFYAKKQAIIEKYKPQVDIAYKKFQTLEDELSKKEIKKQKVIPPEVSAFWKAIRTGVDYGPVDFKLRWQSDDKRFIIWTIPGHKSWFCIGQQKYYSSEHFLSDLYMIDKGKRKDGSSIRGICEIKNIEGKLTKEKLNELIDISKDTKFINSINSDKLKNGYY